MSIIKMQKVAVIGLDTDKEKLINELMDFGAMELSDQTAKLSEEIWANSTTSDEDGEKIVSLEEKLERAEHALEVIEKYGNVKEPLFKTRRKVKKTILDDISSTHEQREKNIRLILDFEDKIDNCSDKFNGLESDAAFLTPWADYDLPLELSGTRNTTVFTGTFPVDNPVDEVAGRLEKEIETVLLKVVGQDREYHYAAAVADKAVSEEVLTVLKEYGFSQVNFNDFEGTAGANLKRIAEEKELLQKEKAETIAQVAANSNLKESIEEYFDLVSIALEKEKIRERLLRTQKTFIIEGWIPSRNVEKAKTILDGNNCVYEFREPQEDEDVPVLVENKHAIMPFESIMEMYSLPSYRGFDPTSIFAIFYAIFFGIMLSDAGYGIVMAVACFVILKKYDLEGSAYKMIKLFFYCGLSTTFWGALFGGWFGDFFQVFAKVVLHKELVIEPIWFNPISDPMKLLIFSMVLGVIHIFIGMGIKAYMYIREGKWFDAICDVGFWYSLISGLILWVAGGMIFTTDTASEVGKWMSIVGALGLLLTGGRHNKGLGKITGGLGALYNITSYLSDILSYSRLLALGLATGVIAQVVNTMGSLFGDGVVGAVLLILIFLVGHTLNFAINALGSYVHACRLQYIEFFGKFYEDGGEAFSPFQAKTKYIKLED